jgi:high-affinity K+ transport system ATPase subunit B
MFTVEVVATLTTILFVRDLIVGKTGRGFALQINLWLWFTVLFANFAEAATPRRPSGRACPRLRAVLVGQRDVLAAHRGIEHAAADCPDLTGNHGKRVDHSRRALR